MVYPVYQIQKYKSFTIHYLHIFYKMFVKQLQMEIQQVV